MEGAVLSRGRSSPESEESYHLRDGDLPFVELGNDTHDILFL